MMRFAVGSFGVRAMPHTYRARCGEKSRYVCPFSPANRPMSRDGHAVRLSTEIDSTSYEQRGGWHLARFPQD
jgi:hypothetical protein